MGATDAQLIQQCLQGNEKAWEELVRRYERLIYYTALRTGVVGDEAADVFQAVCLVWLAQLGRLRNPERLGAWLVTITRREARAYWGSKNGVEADKQRMYMEAIASDELPERLAAAADDARALEWAIRQIPQRCQELLRLMFLEPRRPSYEEAAQELRMAPNSLGPTRTRCLQMLKKILEEAGWRPN